MSLRRESYSGAYRNEFCESSHSRCYCDMQRRQQLRNKQQRRKRQPRRSVGLEQVCSTRDDNAASRSEIGGPSRSMSERDSGMSATPYYCVSADGRRVNRGTYGEVYSIRKSNDWDFNHYKRDMVPIFPYELQFTNDNLLLSSFYYGKQKCPSLCNSMKNKFFLLYYFDTNECYCSHDCFTLMSPGKKTEEGSFCCATPSLMAT